MTLRAIQFVFRLACVAVLVLAVVEVVWMRPAHSAETAPTATKTVDVDERSKADESSVTDESVSQELETKRQALEERARQLDEQEARLKQREKDLEARNQQLEQLRQAVSGELEAQKKNNEDRVAKLVAVFETMTPKSASAVFETLDDWLAVEVLKRMDVKRVAKVMNLMDKNRSAKLSEMLTGYYHPESDRKVASVSTAAGQGTAVAAAQPPAPQTPQNSQKKGGEK